jgi:hypothetical protein
MKVSYERTLGESEMLREPRVQPRGAFTDIDPNCDSGILWSIDKGSQRLAFGDLPNGGAQSLDLPMMTVARGQVKAELDGCRFAVY